MDVCACDQIVLSIFHSTVSLIYRVTFLASLRLSSGQKCFADTSCNLLSDRIFVMYFETELIALKIRQLISREIFLPSRKNKSDYLIVCARISSFYKSTLDTGVSVSWEAVIHCTQCEASCCLNVPLMNLPLMPALEYLMLHWTFYLKVVWMKANYLWIWVLHKALNPEPGDILYNWHSPKKKVLTLFFTVYTTTDTPFPLFHFISLKLPKQDIIG